MRRVLAVALTLVIAFPPVGPVWAAAPSSVPDPLGGGEGSGGFVSLGAFEQGQAQEQQEVQHRRALLQANAPRAAESTKPTPLNFLAAQRVTSGRYAGLYRSWEVVPSDDPLAGVLSDRAWTYDQALAAIALLAEGRSADATAVLQALQRLEAGTGRLGFVYDVARRGRDFLAVFTGTLAWVGMALVRYEQSTGDARFRPMAERLARTILSFEHSATGLLRGGLNANGQRYTWISTEHNVGAYFFLRDLGRVTGEGRYTQAAEEIAAGILTHLWVGDHFRRGYRDNLVVLDAQALGGIFLLAVGDRTRALAVRRFIENNLLRRVQLKRQGLRGPAPWRQWVSGYAPYVGDRFIWVEGSFQVALFDRRLGNTGSADAIVQQMSRLTGLSGGALYAYPRSTSAVPGEQTVYPDLSHVGTTAWLVVQGKAEDLLASGGLP